MAAKKYYAVAAGRSTGIFTDWPSAERQVKGFAGARFKGFADEASARAWLDKPAGGGRPQTARPRTEKSPSPAPLVAAGTVAVYTDGGCSNNPGPGGYGVVIVEDGGQIELSGGYRYTTNNRMEMLAAIVALEEILGRNGVPAPTVLLYSDSSYLVNGIEKGWARGWRARGWKKSDGSQALNSDLWQRLLLLLETLPVTFHWLKGHAGHELNERCDRLAVAALRQEGLPADLEYEKG